MRTWNAKVLAYHQEPLVQPEESSGARLTVFVSFLSARTAANGRTLDRLVGSPEFMPDRWVRLPWLPFGGPDELPRFSGAGWVRAWHGTKMEALYSSAYHGQLVESNCQARGERFFDGSPGIYIYKDELARKVDFYCRFVQLGLDGVHWAHKWELLVDRADRVKPPHTTDQWIQRARSARIVALWCCGRAAKEMHPGDAYSLAWGPLMEATPLDLELALKIQAVALEYGMAHPPAKAPAAPYQQEGLRHARKEEPLTAMAARVSATLPRGWIAVPDATGALTYYNAEYQERALFLQMDPNADELCAQDPLAVSRIWTPSGLLYPWCSYCRKWLDPEHRASIGHGKALFMASCACQNSGPRSSKLGMELELQLCIMVQPFMGASWSSSASSATSSG